MAKKKEPKLTEDERLAAEACEMTPAEYQAYQSNDGARAWQRREHRKALRERAREVLADLVDDE